MHLDLYHHFAGELESDPDVRRRFYEYMKAAEHSISAFHPGLFQLLLAQLAAKTDEATLETLVDGLSEDRLAELHDYPNKALVNQWDGTTPPQLALNLAEKYESERQARREAETEKKAWRDLAKARLSLLRSRGASAARALGLGKTQLTDSGKTPQEKLKNLQKGKQG